MKLIKILLTWIGMILMAITAPLWRVFNYEVTIEANRIK
jgi:hypothetical protein